MHCRNVFTHCIVLKMRINFPVSGQNVSTIMPPPKIHIQKFVPKPHTKVSGILVIGSLSIAFRPDTKFSSPDEHIPVYPRHYIFLHVPHWASLFSLIHRESLQRLCVVIKFCEDCLTTFSDEWAACVTVIPKDGNKTLSKPDNKKKGGGILISTVNPLTNLQNESWSLNWRN